MKPSLAKYRRKKIQLLALALSLATGLMLAAVTPAPGQYAPGRPLLEQPFVPEVGRLAQAHFPTWFREWRRRQPRVTTARFRQIAHHRMWPGGGLYGPGPLDVLSDAFRQRSPLLAWSPDSLMAVDPYAGFDVAFRSGRWETDLVDGDAQVILYDIQRKTRRILLYDTVSGHEDAVWLDRNRFMVVGTTSAIDRAEAPIISVVSLADSTVDVYRGPEVSVTHVVGVSVTPYITRRLQRLLPAGGPAPR